MHKQSNWRGACYIRNVKGLDWNHKRVYRMYREGLATDINFLLPAVRVFAIGTHHQVAREAETSSQ